jgi:plastocyanin
MKNTSKLIAIVAVFGSLSAACGSSSPSTPTTTTTTTPPAAADLTINITGINGSSSFVPSPTTASLGQRVIWKNADTRTHDIIQDANTFTTPNITAGASAAPVTMSTRGTFAYHCGIHPSMVGTITVQ